MENNHFKKTITSHELMAQERTILANERNTLAYIRTGFSAFLLGIGLIKLFEHEAVFVISGWGANILGLIFIVLGLVYYPIRKRKIKSY
jgi:uncharacterized membrane protein YidH (DUF202 family)